MTPIEYGLIFVVAFLAIFIVGWIFVSLGVQIESVIMFCIIVAAIFGAGVVFGQVMQQVGK